MHQVSQGDPRLHLPLKAHQHRFGHIQRHHPSRGGEGDQARASREGDTDREAGMRVPTGTDRIRQQHAVKPGVNNAIARTQRDPATIHNEVRQRVVCLHVDRLRIGGGMTEGLHHQIGGETETGQILQLVARHRAGRILRADGGHPRFAILAGTHAGNAAGTSDDLLRQGVTLVALVDRLRQAEHLARRQIQRLSGPRRQRTTDDQRNSSTGAHLVQQHLCLQGEAGEQRIVGMAADLTAIRIDIDHLAGMQLADIDLNRQCPGIFHRIKENRGNLATQYHPTGPLIGDEGDIFPHQPQHRVGGRLARRAGTDDVTDIGERIPLLGQCMYLANGPNNTGLIRRDPLAWIFQKRLSMQRDIGTRPGILRRRQIIGVRLAADLEYRHRQLLCQGRTRQEPFGIGPGLQHLASERITGTCALIDIMEAVED